MSYDESLIPADQKKPIPAHVPPELVVDFDYVAAAERGTDPFKELEDLVASGVPSIFYTPYRGGHWVCTQMDDILELCRDYEKFTSFPIGTAGIPGKPRKLLPLELDPPDHEKYRRILSPLFTPKAVKGLEAKIREMCVKLIEDLKPKGHCDFVSEFSRVLPTTMIITLVGMPIERLDEFLQWEHEMFSSDPVLRPRGGAAIAKYIGEFVADKVNHPGDDIATHLINSEVDGKKLSTEEVFDICFLLFLAGLDTVPNTFAFAWRYLAEHPEARQRLSDPANIPDGCEELLRLNSVVNSTRRARHDMVWKGVTIKAGEALLMPFALANRDPKHFESPTEVRLDRQSNNHVTFGAGVHRCLGSHLARTEFRIALEEWLKRIPDFQLAEGSKPDTRGGGSMGLLDLPLTWKV